MLKVKRTRPTGNFTIDPDVMDRLRAECEKTEVPLSRVVNRALRKLFNMPKPTANGEPKPAA